jgi:hypothetical protein
LLLLEEGLSQSESQFISMLHLLGVIVDHGVATHAGLVHAVCELERRKQINCGKGCVLESGATLAENVLVEHEVGGEEDRKRLKVDNFGEFVGGSESGVGCVCHQI